MLPDLQAALVPASAALSQLRLPTPRGLGRLGGLLGVALCALLLGASGCATIGGGESSGAGLPFLGDQFALGLILFAIFLGATRLFS